MKKNLPGLRNDSSGVKKTTIFELQPAKEAFLFLTVLFRIAMVGFFLAFSLFFLVITLSLLVGQTDSTSSISQGSTTTKVLGTSTSDDSIFRRVVKTVLGPIGKVSLWLIKLAGDIKLAEGNNITITGDKSKNTITISSTGAATVTGNVDVNLTVGSGILVSGASPDFIIANTSLGSSQPIFKRVAVSSQLISSTDNNDVSPKILKS